MRERRADAGPGGFTLLEILVALAVLAVAGTMIIQLFSSNLRSVALAGDVTSAVARADARMREILTSVPSAEEAWTETTDDGYRMDVSVAESFPERTDGLPVRMMEVSLTVRWTDGGRERSVELRSARMVDRLAQADRN